MKIVIQRVKNASVSVDTQVVGQIQKGMVILLGVDKDDTEKDLDYCVKKCAELRMFEDEQDKMNLCAKEVDGAALVVSQFTLLGNCDKGRRPSFDAAADPQKGEEFYNLFVEKLKQQGICVETGRFRAMMDVALINDGPVTFVIESK
ncbi:MAG: D-aminoacyl-tRNA deacylase [Candidatus Omnitrophota bacterium]